MSIGQLVARAKKRGLDTRHLEPNLFRSRAKSGDARNEREKPSPEQMRAFFSSPLFTGCAGYEDRKKGGLRPMDTPGEHIFHRAAYLVPIIMAYHGFRREEVCGLAVDDILDAASRVKGADLSRISVQMKLSIVSDERSEEVVPKISEFANSQNKVNAADFFTNHPFHLQIERLSRHIFVPSADGGFIQTKWFYERARGQYADERSRRTEAQKKKFDIEFPKHQLLTKTDLAKVLSVWNGQPHIVARGAQKNFVEFAKHVGETWESKKDDYNESFFRECVAKAIIFRETERIVSDQPWYTGGGSRAPIVAYAIAMMANAVRECGDAVNFDLVWRMQGLPKALRAALEVATAAANALITHPPVTSQSITEWAKQPACWKRAQDIKIDWPDNFDAALVLKSDADGDRRTARNEQKMTNGIEAQTLAVQAGHAFWAKALTWARANYRMTPTDAGILQTLATPGKIGTDRQCLRAMQLLSAMNEDGCPLRISDVAAAPAG